MRIAPLILALCLPLLVRAQADSVTWSEPFKPGKGSSGGRLIHADSTGIWFYERTSAKEPSLMLARLDKAMKTLWRSTITIAQDAGAQIQEPEHILVVQGNVYLFTVGLSTAGTHWNTYAQAIDTTGKAIAGPVLIHTEADVWKGSKPELVISESPDKEKFLLLFDAPFGRKSQEGITITVCDATLEILWTRDLELPYEQDVVQVHHFGLDNEGGVYLISGENPQKHTANWQRPQGNRYVVFHYDNTTNMLREFDVSLKDKQVGTLQFLINAQSELIIAGFYSNDYQLTAAGTFLFVLSARSDEVKVASYMPFPPELLREYLTERQANRKAGIPDFYLDHLYMSDDGTYWMAGEQFAISENLIMDPMTGRQLIERRFTYDDILAVQLDASARIIQTRRIARRQFDTSRNPLLSYVCLWDKTAQGLRILFNDHPENEARMGPQGENAAPLAWNGTRNAAVTEAKVGSSSFSRRVIHRSKSSDYQLRPDMITGATNAGCIGFEGPREFRFALLPAWK
jgi:hypothetical protein